MKSNHYDDSQCNHHHSPSVKQAEHAGEKRNGGHENTHPGMLVFMTAIDSRSDERFPFMFPVLFSVNRLSMKCREMNPGDDVTGTLVGSVVHG